MPHDQVSTSPLATPEAQDAYLAAAFASGHPGLIADAGSKVASAREAAGIPDDDRWATTRDLFQSTSNVAHLLTATAEAEAYLKATGQTAIEGPIPE